MTIAQSMMTVCCCKLKSFFFFLSDFIDDKESTIVNNRKKEKSRHDLSFFDCAKKKHTDERSKIFMNSFRVNIIDSIQQKFHNFYDTLPIKTS